MKYFSCLILCLLLSSCDKADDPLEEVIPDEKTIELSRISRREVDHNREFYFRINPESTAGDTIIFEVSHPEWMSYDPTTAELKGIAGWDNIGGLFRIGIRVTNLIDTAFTSFDVDVLLGEIRCESEFGDASESQYILPYHVGESYRMWQSYCHPIWSHKDWFSFDFEMPMGTEIIASRAGTVIFERDNFPDGTRVSGEENWVFIQHDDGTVIHYVHLMEGGSLVTVGQRVEQGEVIGLSGDSGGSAGPHLHTTLFVGRNNFNRQYSMPMNYRNAEGPLNAQNGLVIDEYYTALPY